MKSQKIRIAHVITAYNSVISILYSKLNALSKYSDLDVSVISSAPTGETTKESPVRHISVEISRNIKPWSDLKSVWNLCSVLRREKFDIVHSHTAKAGFITAIAGTMARVPLIFHTYHGLPFFEGQRKGTFQIYRFLEKTACRFRSHIFSQNKRDIRACIDLMGSENKVTYEGNGVDVEFVEQQAQIQFKEANNDYPGRGIRLLSLGRLEPVKRIPDFLKVTNKLIKDGVEVSCVVAGGGILEEKLKSEVAESGLGDHVRMVGRSSRAFGLILACDIIILCSEKEGIPRSLMEAMALQKPVIATDVLGTQELVLNGETGYLIPLGDTDRIAEKIKLLIGNKELSAKMGAAGLERVKNEFNDKKIVESLHGFYLKAMEQI